MARGQRWMGGAPGWAWVVMLVGAIVLIVGVPIALQHGKLTAAEVAQMNAEAAVAPSPAAPAPPAFTVPQEPRLLILGDSYTEGFGAQPETDGYAYLVAEDLGWEHQIDGVGGTGFTWDGEGVSAQRYSQRIADLAEAETFAPNVVILQGGQNDYRSAPAELAQAVTAAVEQLREAWPGVQVVIFGPAAPQPLGDDLRPVDDAIRSGAEAAAVPYISPSAGRWLTTENSDQYAYRDGSHLNEAGHHYLADRLLADLRALIGEAEPAA